MTSSNPSHVSSAPPICDVDFYSDLSLSDPVSVYSKMLQTGPVVWLPQNNLYAICQFSTLTESLRNHQCFLSGKGVSINEDVNKMLIGSTLNSDPPQHDITRSITFSPLTPKALKSVQGRIEDEANFIADQMVAQGRFDAAQELAPYLPLTVVRELVGLGEHGKSNMLKWGAATFELMGDPRERRDAAVENLKQLRKFLEDPDTLQSLTHNGWASAATTRGMSEGILTDRANELMRDYIAPSLDTTISAIGYAMMLFAQNPIEWQKLRSDRSLIKNAIEEVVRLNTPIKAFSRFIAKDVEIEGVHLKKDHRVLMVFGAANRDPKRFSNPHKFDIERDVRGHVGFGHGVHACLGMHLARLEMSSLFNALADRIETIELTGPVVPTINSSIYSLASIPVRVNS